MLTYGSKVNGEMVELLIHHALDNMMQQGSNTARPTPLCIWGLHGIGKTELVRDLAKARGCAFVYVAPAQFEEMGDLVGMPKIIETAEKGSVTHFAPPEWVPTNEGPGILLLDDINRADDRILRGLMQLMQNYELVSWSLPQRWLIIMTANPDGGDYSVTTMDDAMLTRMLHITMEFDVRAWARWAERADIDPRGIQFVLSYPELVNGRRTTPRSLVQFFQAIAAIDHFGDNLPLIKMIGDACLDNTATISFLNFIHLQLDRLPAVEEILQTNDFQSVEKRLSRIIKEGDTQRLDVLSVLIMRIIHHLQMRTQNISALEMKNLRQFILMDLLPNDLRLSMAQELTREVKRPELTRLYADPVIGQLLLKKM
jgi:AAA domain (dynein-related subfamily)